MKCNYRNCLKELLAGVNGNKRYCDEECSYLERLEREKEKNKVKRNILSEINRIQALLRACQKIYGDSLFDVNILRELRMNWAIISGTTQIEGHEYRVVGSFAYSVFQTGKIRIIKL